MSAVVFFPVVTSGHILPEDGRLKNKAKMLQVLQVEEDRITILQDIPINDSLILGVIKRMKKHGCSRFFVFVCLVLGFRYLSSDYVDAKLYSSEEFRFAIVRKGTLLDCSGSFWIERDGKWFEFYLDHEFFRWERFDLSLDDDSLMITKNRKPFAVFDQDRMEISRWKCPNRISKPHTAIWKVDDGTILWAYLDSRRDEIRLGDVHVAHSGDCFSKVWIAISKESIIPL